MMVCFSWFVLMIFESCAYVFRGLTFPVLKVERLTRSNIAAMFDSTLLQCWSQHWSNVFWG